MPLSKQSAFVWAVFVSVLAGLLAALAARAQNRDEDEHKRIPKRIVADYTSGAKFLNPPYDVAQIPFHKLTHIIHAGIPWHSDGSLYIENGFVEPDLIRKAHAHGVKAMLLTGGDFAAIEASPQVFDTVLANLRTFVTENDYDGVDIDWEFPSDATDRAFFVTLIRRLRATLPQPALHALRRPGPLEWRFLQYKPAQEVGRLLQPHGLRLRRSLDRHGPPELADLLGQSRPSPRRVRARSQCPASRRALSLYLKTVPAKLEQRHAVLRL